MNTVAGYRRMADYTQEEMAKILEISKTNYQSKETGKLDFRRTEMVKFTKAIKEKKPEVTMHDIFFF